MTEKSSQPSSAAPASELAEFNNDFAAHVAKDGLAQLTRLSSWLYRGARARLRDEVRETFSGRAFAQLTQEERRAFGFTLLRRVLSGARTADNSSTSVGGNALNLATLAAEADMVRSCLGNELASLEEAAWTVAKEQQRVQVAAVEQLKDIARQQASGQA